jgi:hypothetical protein
MEIHANGTAVTQLKDPIARDPSKDPLCTRWLVTYHERSRNYPNKLDKCVFAHVHAHIHESNPAVEIVTLDIVPIDLVADIGRIADPAPTLGIAQVPEIVLNNQGINPALIPGHDIPAVLLADPPAVTRQKTG